jgi:Holliday junction resolvase RusA-like endonuclease
MYANTKARGRKGRRISFGYFAWKRLAGWQLKSQLQQEPLKIDGPLVINIDLDDTRKGDCDNRIKPLLDLLVTHGVIAGDSKKHVKRVSMGWEKVDGCRMILEGA